MFISYGDEVRPTSEYGVYDSAVGRVLELAEDQEPGCSVTLSSRVGGPSDERQKVSSDVPDGAVVRGESMDPPWREELKFPGGGIAAVKVLLKVAPLDAPAQPG